MKKKQNLSESNSSLSINGKDKKVGIVTSEWNSEITFSMEKSAIATLLKNGVSKENIFSLKVPGTFELPLGAKIIHRKNSVDAIICIGCVIKGETDHDRYISQSVAGAIQSLNLVMEKPVVFGVLTPNNMEQALERSGGKYGNKGDEAAITALHMMALNDGDKKNKIGY